MLLVGPLPPLQKKGIDEDDAWLLGGKKGGKGKAKAKKGEAPHGEAHPPCTCCCAQTA